uniref:Uncharacterized protein n=1 Tax=Meloidogyne enterolobii TaxID=390850 RepID=A0A6V7YBW4_MELEN|nr:unnamed protein product [Meloidogyne enterolobii]
MGNKQNGSIINTEFNNNSNNNNTISINKSNSSKFSSSSIQNNNNNTPPIISINNNRINRRRSEFQQSSKKPLNCDNRINISGGDSGGNSNILIGINGGGILNERTRRARRWSSVVTVSRSNGKPKRLTPRQCHLIIKSWGRRTPKSRVVKDIFALIFGEVEELKSSFGVEQNIAGRRLRTDSNFVSHTNLKHATFPLENGFKQEYWNIFAECIVEGISAGEECKETLLAWRQLVQTVIYYMKLLGYDRETLRLARHASLRRSYSPTRAARIQQQQSLEQPSQRFSSGLIPISPLAVSFEETNNYRQQALLDETRRNSYTTKMSTLSTPTMDNNE